MFCLIKVGLKNTLLPKAAVEKRCGVDRGCIIVIIGSNEGDGKAKQETEGNGEKRGQSRLWFWNFGN